MVFENERHGHRPKELQPMETSRLILTHQFENHIIETLQISVGSVETLGKDCLKFSKVSKYEVGFLSFKA